MSQSIIVPAYEKGVNYFKLFMESEEVLHKYEYQTHTIEEVWSQHRSIGDKPVDHYFYYTMYSHNLRVREKQKGRSFKTDSQIVANLNKTDSSDFAWAFVTVNWDDNNVTVAKMLKASKSIFEKPWVASGSLMVLEKHRKDEGIHHHTHYLIKFDEKKEPSRVIDETWKSAGVKSICREKNWVDYIGPQKAKKGFRPYQTYYNYIHGQKTEEKMPYVEKDRTWREENNIEHIYIK